MNGEFKTEDKEVIRKYEKYFGNGSNEVFEDAEIVTADELPKEAPKKRGRPAKT